MTNSPPARLEALSDGVIAYTILQRGIVVSQGRDSRLAAALGSDWKGKVSLGSYAAAVALAFIDPRLSDLLYVFVAALWVIPDCRTEQLAPAEP